MFSKSRHWLAQWGALKAWERVVLVRCVFSLWCIQIELLWRDLPKVLARYSQARPAARGCMLPANASSEEFAARCHHLVAIAAFHSLGQKSCLPAALVLIRLLARHGLNAQLMIGVKPHASTIQAHAWVEFAGRVLGESVADFQPLDSIRAVRYT